MNLRQILDYVYPPRCPVCDKISAQGICDKCREHLFFIRDDYCMKCGKPLEDERQEFCPDCKKRKHYFVQGRSLLSYQGPVRKSLYRLKYGNKREYAGVYGAEMADYLGKWIRQRGITKIVPVPLYPARQRARGYNQAALLAESMGRRMGLPVDKKLLYRTKKTAPQKVLTSAQRKANLEKAFVVKGNVCSGERILLVDDIFTTGSTVDAAAKALKQAGDCSVFAATAAIGG